MHKPSRPTTSVALALTPEYLFAVQVRSENGQLAVVNSGSEIVPEGCFTDGAVTDPQQLGRTIRSLWNRLGFRERSASVVLPSGLCSLRAVRLPHLPAPERRAVVRGELEHVGALPFHAGAFDFFWVEDNTPGEPALAEAFALYTSDDVVTGIRSVLRFADLRLAKLEPMSVGVLRACSLSESDDAPKAVLCLDEQAADFCILEAGQVRYLRRIPSGWSDLQAQIRSLVSRSTATVASAEPFHGREAVGDPASLFANSPDPSPQAVPFLVTEAVRSMAYYGRVRGTSPNPSQLLIPAGSDDFRALTSIFGDAAVPDLTPMSPQTAFGVDGVSGLMEPSSTFHAQFLAAIGTAASAVGLTGRLPSLDLAQDDPTIQVVNPWATALPPALIGSVVWLVLSAVLCGGLTTNADRAEYEQQLLSGRAVEIHAQQAPLLLQEQLQARTQVYQSKADLPIASLLGQVAAAFAKDLSLQTLSVTGEGDVSLSGTGLTADGVQRFSYALANGKTLREPRIDTLRQEAPDQASFRIMGKVVPRVLSTKQPAGGT